MRRFLLLGGLALLLASMTLSMSLYAKPSIEIRVVKGVYQDGVLRVNVTCRTLVAILTVRQPVLVSLDGLAGVSVVKPAYLLAVSNETRVGPASVLYLTPGTWKLYVIPLEPHVTVTIRFVG